MVRLRFALALALLLPAGFARAGIENAGTTAGNFLSVGTGAGVLSMGGATLGAGRDLNAAAWNPAVLGYLGSSEYAISHATLALDVSQDWLAASGRFGRSATRWSASALYQNDGAFDGRDAFGGSTGSFNVSNLAVGLALARPFSPDVTAGARVHFVNESLGSASGTGYGVDLGLQARRGAFGFGAAARNLGGKMKYDSGSYDLPSVIGVGAAWTDARSGVRLALDANFPHAYYNDVRVGGEWTWQQRVALRAGYRMELGAPTGEPLGGPSFGFGTGVNGLWFDYAFLAGNSDASGAHRFGLTFHPAVFQQRGARPFADDAARTPEPAPVAVATPASPRPAPRAEAPAPRAETPAPALALAPPAEGAATRVAARPAAPADAKYAALKPVRVPRLTEARLEPVAAAPAPAKPAASLAPVAIVRAPAPAPAAPAAPVAVVTPPAPQPAAPAPVAQLAATPAPAVTVVKPAPLPAERPATVVVGKDDTLALIAKRWGTSVAAIMMENNLVSQTVKAGQKLKLPKP